MRPAAITAATAVLLTLALAASTPVHLRAQSRPGDTNPAPAALSSNAQTLRLDATSAGASPWTPFVADPANAIALGAAAGAPWTARLEVRTLAPQPAAWHVNLSYRNRLLQQLAPNTDYLLRFRARADAPRPITLELARHHQPYRNLGLLQDVNLDAQGRDYEIAFRTADSIPPLREPSSSGVWLTFAAGQTKGTVWIGAVTIVRAERRRLAARALPLATFAPEEGWKGGRVLRNERSGGAPALRLSAPANGVAFASRELPMDLSGPEWNLVLRLQTANPTRVGRVVVLIRPGQGKGEGFAFQSFSGLRAGWNRVVLPRAAFHRYAWQGDFSWGDVRELAVKLETNGNGPAEVLLAGITAEPGDSGPLPPVVTHLGIEHLGLGRVRVRWATDTAAAGAIEYGATTAYGTRVAATSRALEHSLELTGLAPGRTFHARVTTAGAAGVNGASGDFTFVTDPAVPWIGAARPGGARFPLGVYVATTADDVRHAAWSDFDAFTSYRFNSCGDSDAEARAYLDAAAAAGGRAMIGFCTSAVVAGDTTAMLARVRALAAHPALLGWYLFDEPEWKKVPPAALARLRDAIRRADPAHPVLVSMAAPTTPAAYHDACDIAVPGNYPVPFAPVESIVPLLRAVRDTRTPFQFAFQSYDLDVHRWPGVSPGPGRYPSRDEMRAMAWLAVVHGARGLWTYAYAYLHDTPGSEWHWADVVTVAHELRRMEPLLLAPEAPGGSIDAGAAKSIHACVRVLGGARYVIAVNAAPTTVRSTLRVPGAASGSAREVFEGRAVPVRAGAITDAWPGYGVRVYALAGR